MECQGACVNAPMVIIFKDAYEDLTPERLEEIIDTFEAGKGDTVKTGPQIDRHESVPVGGLTTLTEEIKPDRSNLDKPAEVPADAAPVPPSNAAKPKTDAPETDPKLKTPANEPKAAEANVKAAEKEASGSAKPSLDSKDRPAGIEKPATPDDLKLISGVGPKIEGTLHELGIFTFAQVAGWKKAECDWVDGYLNFKGRIERDEWIKQAEALAKGGEAEYIKVFGKKPR